MVKHECVSCALAKKGDGSGMIVKGGTMYVNSGEPLRCTASYIEKMDLSGDGMTCSSFRPKAGWTDGLPADVYHRLCECRSRREDIETLVNVKWAAMVAAGKREEGFKKEDALVQILELLDSNDQFFDLSRAEYDGLKYE